MKSLFVWRIKGCIALVLMYVLLSACTWGVVKENPQASPPQPTKYTLHVGLNDKDTYKQEIGTEKARQLATEICLKYVDGVTIYGCNGFYKDKKGEVTKENSLVLEFYGAAEEKIKGIMDELLVSLNQESILLEKGNVTYEFYSRGVSEK